MKACAISFSLELLLKTLGLENIKEGQGDYKLINAYPHHRIPNTIVLNIESESLDIEDIHRGGIIPDAVIRCEKTEAKIEIL